MSDPVLRSYILNMANRSYVVSNSTSGFFLLKIASVDIVNYLHRAHTFL